MVVGKQCKYCKKYFVSKHNRVRQKFCGVDCSIKWRLESGWNKKPEMIKSLNTMSSGRCRCKGIETWRNVDSM
jgi:hypothetical protein